MLCASCHSSAARRPGIIAGQAGPGCARAGGASDQRRRRSAPPLPGGLPDGLARPGHDSRAAVPAPEPPRPVSAALYDGPAPAYKLPLARDGSSPGAAPATMLHRISSPDRGPLGDSLAVELPALDRTALVRIQVPQPNLTFRQMAVIAASGRA